MYKEDSLQFVQERLRHNHSSTFARELHLRAPARVTRRFVAEMEKGEARTFDHVNASVQLRCANGSLWITNDGTRRTSCSGRGRPIAPSVKTPCTCMRCSRRCWRSSSRTMRARTDA